MIVADDIPDKEPSIIIEEVVKQNKLIFVETIIDPNAFIGVNNLPLEKFQPQDNINPLLGFVNNDAGPSGVDKSASQRSLGNLNSLQDHGDQMKSPIIVNCGGTSLVSNSGDSSDSSLKAKSAPPGFSIYSSKANLDISS